MLKIMPKDSEIIAILRVIDINDDGVIDKTEFDYFIGLFNLRVGSSEASIMSKLRDRNRRDNEHNYFGEKRTEGSLGTSHGASVQATSGAGASSGGYVSSMREVERRTGYMTSSGAGNVSPSRLNRRRIEAEAGFGTSSSGVYTRKTIATEGIKQRREYTDTSPGLRDIERKTFGTSVSGTASSPSFMYQKTVTYEGGYSPIRAAESQTKLTRAELQRAREVSATGTNADRYRREVEELRKMDRSITRPSENRPSAFGGRSREVSKSRDRSATPTHVRTRLESRIGHTSSYVGIERSPLSNIGNSNLRGGLGTYDREGFRRTAGERPTLSGGQVVEEVIYKRSSPAIGVENVTYQRSSPTKVRPSPGLAVINHQSNSSFRAQETGLNVSPRHHETDVGHIVSHSSSGINREIKFIQ